MKRASIQSINGILYAIIVEEESFSIHLLNENSSSLYLCKHVHVDHVVLYSNERMKLCTILQNQCTLYDTNDLESPQEQLYLQHQITETKQNERYLCFFNTEKELIIYRKSDFASVAVINVGGDVFDIGDKWLAYPCVDNSSAEDDNHDEYDKIKCKVNQIAETLWMFGERSLSYMNLLEKPTVSEEAKPNVIMILIPHSGKAD
jgi:hypothetical protein